MTPARVSLFLIVPADRRPTNRQTAVNSSIWRAKLSGESLDASGFPALWPWTFARFRREMQKADLSAFELKA